MSMEVESTLMEAGDVLHDLLTWALVTGGWEAEVWERAEVVMLKIDAIFGNGTEAN